MPAQLIFISIDGMTDPLGQSQVIPYLTGLAEKGFNITVISCEKKANFTLNQKQISQHLENAGIKWRYCFYSQKIPVLSQRGNLQKLKALAVTEVKKTGKKTLVHCRSYLPALIGLYLKKKYDTKFIFDMRGFWADERVEGKIWKLKNPVHKTAYKYFKRKEKELIAKADYTVTLTENAKNIVNKWNSEKKIKIEVIPCCTDLSHFKIWNEEEKLSVRKKLHLGADAFVLGYLGSLGTWYMLDEMLDFFIEFQKVNPASVLLFITHDKPEQILKAALKKNIRKNCILIQSAVRKEVPEYVSTFNAGLFFIRPTFSKKGSSPTKMAEILACGIPVITNSGIGDSDEIISESACGIVLDNFTVKNYQTAINDFSKINRNDPEFLRTVAKKYFSLEKGVSSYEKIYRYLSGG
ncbi:MAG TPA: glycosyltransferase [Bacteroidia bacterium]|jgi:glycosyltransferase involved in cell wall biosynthesis|nr:glycosyltransferase [Bacteroidia bacterium]